MIYVRWKRGEPRRGRVFPPLTSDHPLFDQRCVQCDDVLGTGEEIQLVAVGPTSPEHQAKHDAGRWYNAGAVALHRRDVDAMTDTDLDRLTSELVVMGEA